MGRPRRRIPLWAQVVFVVAVVGAGVVTVVHDSASRKPTKQAVVPASSSSISVVPPVPSDDPCAFDACALSQTVNPDLVAALRQYVPRSGAPTETTLVTGPDGSVIEHRLIESVFGSVDLLVRINRYTHPSHTSPSAIKATPPGLASAFLEVENASYVVDLEWIGPETQPPPIDALNKLIRDSRLEE